MPVLSSTSCQRFAARSLSNIDQGLGSLGVDIDLRRLGQEPVRTTTDGSQEASSVRMNRHHRRSALVAIDDHCVDPFLRDVLSRRDEHQTNVAEIDFVALVRSSTLPYSSPLTRTPLAPCMSMDLELVTFAKRSWRDDEIER